MRDHLGRQYESPGGGRADTGGVTGTEELREPSTKCGSRAFSAGLIPQPVTAPHECDCLAEARIRV